ncbi:hypothetical protein FB45DRAFT_906656 [Roridomyces roridus]|uniref:Uncharacterized protein n=1 Tax=Roridomyces roridus TaxID=1738132 RepID=A0AAD7FTC0_9AGAR|nr:hypothetical protein FB45DRAFT_906656 [Roridomyces roridus]
MAFAFLPLPFLNSFSLPVQFLILLGLAFCAYRYETFRAILMPIVGIYCLYKVTVPLVRWAFFVFKTIAWFGFYVNFFLLGIGYIFTGAMGIWNFPELLQTFMDSLEGK